MTQRKMNFLILFVEKVAFDSHGMLHDAVEGDHDHSRGNSKGKTLSTKSAIVLLVAMSLHSLIETVALGIAKDKTSAAMMAASIGLHQPAETLALLVAFLKISVLVVVCASAHLVREIRRQE